MAIARRLLAAGETFVSAVAADTTVREGFIYVITHPSWPGHCKIGRAFDPLSRLQGYQTGCPERAYQLHSSVYFKDCHAAEQLVHEALADFRGLGEWFFIHPTYAAATIKQLKQEKYL